MVSANLPPLSVGTASGRPDTLAVDTVGDGVADTLIPLQRTASDLDLQQDLAQIAARAEFVDSCAANGIAKRRSTV